MKALSAAALFPILLGTFVFQPFAESQSETWWGPGVRVLAEVESFVFDWSPNGQSFASADESGILLREAPDFRDPKRWTLAGWNGTEPITNLRWSPDGRKLAFVSPWRPGDWNTVWVTAPGEPVRDLLPPAVSNLFGSPGVRTLLLGPWLNESEIVFEQHCGTECRAIHKVNTDNSSYGTLCYASVSEEIQWAQAGARAMITGHLGSLAVARSDDFSPSGPDNYPRSTCQEVLPGCNGGSGGERFAFQSWAPDGRQALLTRFACQDDPGVSPVGEQLFLWDIDDGAPVRLLANATLASWSPGGAQVAFLLLGSPTYDAQGRLVGSSLSAGPFPAHLGILDVATRSARIIAPLGLIDPEQEPSWSQFRQPTWSPDGRKIAYLNAQNDLYAVQPDGSNPRLVVRGMLSVVHWSPDSRRMAIQVNKQPGFWVGVEAPYLVEVD